MQVISVTSATNGAIDKSAVDVVARVIIDGTAIVATAIVSVTHDIICFIRVGIGTLRFGSCGR
jgi:hypothetical protein